MKKENIVLVKSFDFSVRIVNLYKWLCQEKKEFILSKQILRSGTSIGANLEEAQGGQSRKDFYAKLSISYKEARETRYWIRLLKATDYIDKVDADSLINDCDELLKIIGSIQNSIRNS